MRLLLADDNHLLIEGLLNLLSAYNIEVVGLAYDGNEAIQLAKETKPDVILMDIRMPVCDGLCATQQIIADNPEVKIIILTTSTEDQDLFEAVKRGAYGYLLKSIDVAELVEGLNQALEGIPPFSPGLANKIFTEFARLGKVNPNPGETAHPELGSQLTARQREVLSLVAQGYTYKEVGQKLALSSRTVKYHMAEILEKLHLENRSQVIASAGRMGLNGKNPDG